MKSPLNIEETVKRYSLDAEMSEKLKVFDAFIWQECEIQSLEQLVELEKKYQLLSKDFDFAYDSEYGEFRFVNMDDGEMSLLRRGRFLAFADVFAKNEYGQSLMKAGLTDLEAVVLETFFADMSCLYRLDAYYSGIPPFVRSICDVLNRGIGKLPTYTGVVVRACNEYDKADFEVGDIFIPGFCLTTSADLTWESKSENRYRIQTLTDGKTKARKLFAVRDISEKQVTFMQDAQFRIIDIMDWGYGKKEFVMEEI